jgi:hypothetical protein
MELYLKWKWLFMIDCHGMFFNEYVLMIVCALVFICFVGFSIKTKICYETCHGSKLLSCDEGMQWWAICCEVQKLMNKWSC